MAQTIFGFLNGMVAGWAQVFVMQPFQIIKVRLQTQSAQAKVYNGIFDCLTKIIKNEGPLALYKGTVTPLMGVGLLGSIRFGLFEKFKRSIAESQSKTVANLTLFDKSLCAFATGFLNSFVLCPIEHTRIRIQIQRGSADKVYSGSIDACVKIAKQHGVKGLWRGQGPSTVRESTGLMFYFSGIEGITTLLTPAGVTDKKNLPLYVPMMAGGLGGTLYWVFNYPFDYVKTLMQSDKFGEFKYRSMAQCFKDQYAQGGVKTFFKGYLICMMRSFPVNAAALITYRTMQKVTGVSAN